MHPSLMGAEEEARVLAGAATQMACSHTCPAAQSALVSQPTLIGEEDGAGTGAEETMTGVEEEGAGGCSGAEEGAALGTVEGAAEDGALEGNEL